MDDWTDIFDDIKDNETVCHKCVQKYNFDFESDESFCPYCGHTMKWYTVKRSDFHNEGFKQDVQT